VKVAEHIFASGLAGVTEPPDLQAFIHAQLYKPEYAGSAQ